jgi:hypothetical protein
VLVSLVFYVHCLVVNIKNNKKFSYVILNSNICSCMHINHQNRQQTIEITTIERANCKLLPKPEQIILWTETKSQSENQFSGAEQQIGKTARQKNVNWSDIETITMKLGWNIHGINTSSHHDYVYKKLKYAHQYWMKYMLSKSN